MLVIFNYTWISGWAFGRKKKIIDLSTHDSSDNEDSDDDDDDDESIGDMELPEYVSWDEFQV